MSEKFFKRDLGGAVFLLFLGIMFLLNTTGIVNWGIWLHILQFWPVFLILGGIKLILQGTKITEIILTVISALLFAVVGVLAYSSYTKQNIPFIPFNISRYITDVTTDTDTTDYTKEENLTVAFDSYKDVEARTLGVNIAASQVNITDDIDENYFEATGQYDERYVTPTVESKLSDGGLSILFDTNYVTNIAHWTSTTPRFNLSIGQPDIPTDISFKIGAGEGNLTLSKLLINKISAQVGAGQLDLDLSGKSIPQEINVDVGAGEINIKLPEGVGFEMSYSLGIGEINENGKEIATFSGKNSSYKSDNYQNAQTIVKITARVGVGQLSIEHN